MHPFPPFLRTAKNRNGHQVSSGDLPIKAMPMTSFTLRKERYASSSWLRRLSLLVSKDGKRTIEMILAIAGRDGELDPRQPCNLSVPPYTKMLTGEIKGTRIGLVKEGFDSPPIDSLVRESVKSAADLLRKEAGASVEEVSIPWHVPGGKVASAILLENSGMAFLNGLTFRTSQYNDTHLQQAIARGVKTQQNQLSRISKFLILMSRYMKEACNGVVYSKAQNLRSELTKAYDEALKGFDVLIMPTCPDLCKAFPDKDAPIKEYMDSALISHPNTAQFDVSGHPALSINVPPIDELKSFPIGMMIVGKKFDEVTVLNVAYAYENLRDLMKAKEFLSE